MERFSSPFLALVVAGALLMPVSTPTAASALTVAKHDQSHPMVMQWAADLANSPAPPTQSSVQLTSYRSVALAAPNPQLQREVFGFVNAGNMNSSSVGWTTWNLRLLSTVAFFGLQVNSGDGNLVQSGTGWSVYHSQAMLNFVNAAHAAGTRVIVSINLHDFSTSPSNQICNGLIAANAQHTIDQSVFQIAADGIDGLNIDYEGTNTTCTNGLTSRDQFTAFMQHLRATMPAGKYLAVDTYAGSAEDNLEFFDITGLGPSVDSFFVMAYDSDYSNSTEAPLNCTSYCFNPVSPLNTYRFNATKSMTQYKALVPASKIILGQPYYGRRGCVANLSTAHQYPTPNTNFASPTYIFASTVPSQTGVFGFAAHRDPSEGVAEWDTWYDSDHVCNREQYFDDVQSLAAKYDLINANDLRGVGLFSLDYAGSSTELWNLIAAKFTTTTPWTSLLGVLTSAPDASTWGAARIDAFARGTDNGLWQQTWNGTTWAGWAPLGGKLSADPGAVSWGPNRIDVFIRGQDNALWHRYSDGTTWSGWESVGGSFSSGPDVASWGTSRLDIFVRGNDNALWHKFWDGHQWGSWESLGGFLTSNPTAVSWGPNRLDIFARGGDNQMWHKAWLGSRWSAWEPLGGGFISGPDSASCASNRLDLFGVGNDHGLWRKSWTGSAWTGWSPQGGRWTSDPSAVCSPGTTTLTLFARGIDYAVWTTNMPGTA